MPALFTDEEKDTIIGQCRNMAKENGYAVSKYVYMFMFGVRGVS